MRPFFPVTGNLPVYQPWVSVCKLGIGEPHAYQCILTVIGYKNIRALQQAVHDRHAIRVLQVDHNTMLIGVLLIKGDIFIRLRRHVYQRAHIAHRITLGGFYLDHICAPIRHNAG